MSSTTEFCKLCNNLLTPNAEKEDLLFICMSCGESFKSTPRDTLRYEEVTKGGDLSMFEKIIRKIKYDPVNPIVRGKCPSCGYGLIKQNRLGKSLKIVNACMGEKCDHIWL